MIFASGLGTLSDQLDPAKILFAGFCLSAAAPESRKYSSAIDYRLPRYKIPREMSIA
jgi:hypothetical protein